MRISAVISCCSAVLVASCQREKRDLRPAPPELAIFGDAARAFDIETKALAENSQSGDQFFGIHVSNHGRVMIFAGGIPLKRGNQVMGAIGVSGGMGKQDQAVAEAGAEAF